MVECRTRRRVRTVPGLLGAECVRDDGHDGDHEDVAGNRWPTDEPAADETPTQLPQVGEGGSTAGDGETPAQPTTCPNVTCGATRAEYDRDPCTRHACGLRDDAQPDVAPAQPDELVIETVTPANLEATARATGGGYRSPDIELPDAAPAPHGNAGGAGDEVYLLAAEAYTGLRGEPAQGWAVFDRFRLAIDAARTPLLAETATYESAWSVAEGALAEAIRERDEARAIVEQLLDLLRDVWAHGVIPPLLSAEIEKWLGPVIRDRRT